jgi:hypothetical protein
MSEIPGSFEALYILLILLPGFLTLLIEKGLAFQREDSGLMTVIKALIYSFIIYSIFTPFNIPPVTLISSINQDGKYLNSIIKPNWQGSFLLLGLSIIIGLIIGVF